MVGAADLVPKGDVLFHAVGQAGLLAGRQGCAGGGNALGEAVVVHFLGEDLAPA